MTHALAMLEATKFKREKLVNTSNFFLNGRRIAKAFKKDKEHRVEKIPRYHIATFQPQRRTTSPLQ